MAAKSGGENEFWEKSPVDSADTLWVKNFAKMSILLHFRDTRFFAFYAEIQNGQQKWGKTILGKSRQQTILLRFRDKCFFAFYAEIQDGCQSGGKMILGEVASTLCR